MLIATFCLGDSLVLLTAGQSLDSDDVLKRHYELTFKDLTSDKSYTHVYVGENEAVQAFAAVLVADDAGRIGDILDKYVQALYLTPAKNFLP